VFGVDLVNIDIDPASGLSILSIWVLLAAGQLGWPAAARAAAAAAALLLLYAVSE